MDLVTIAVHALSQDLNELVSNVEVRSEQLTSVTIEGTRVQLYDNPKSGRWECLSGGKIRVDGESQLAVVRAVAFQIRVGMWD